IRPPLRYLLALGFQRNSLPTLPRLSSHKLSKLPLELFPYYVAPFKINSASTIAGNSALILSAVVPSRQLITPYRSSSTLSVNKYALNGLSAGSPFDTIANTPSSSLRTCPT